MKLYHLDWKRAERKIGEGAVDLIHGFGSPDETNGKYLGAFDEGLYDHVADVDGLSIDEIFPATNNGVASEVWSLRPPEGITLSAKAMLSSKPLRSTSVGDIVADGDSLYVCAPIGWRLIREPETAPAP